MKDGAVKQSENANSIDPNEGASRGLLMAHSAFGGLKKASRSFFEVNSPAQSGQSQTVRTRSFPLDAAFTVNSCLCQTQAQLPETSIPHFLHRSRFMPPFRSSDPESSTVIATTVGRRALAA